MSTKWKSSRHNAEANAADERRRAAAEAHNRREAQREAQRVQAERERAAKAEADRRAREMVRVSSTRGAQIGRG